MESNKLRKIQRVRAKISGTVIRPRLAVFRSAKQIYAQLIDDVKGITLVAVSSKEIKAEGKPLEIAQKTGELLAQKARAKKIDTVVFDRRNYKFHGQVKALAEGAKAGGIKI